MDSPEYVGNAVGAPSARAFVEELYVKFLGRPTDKGGVDFWTARLASGGASLGDIAAGFAGSAEAQARYAAETSTGVWVADQDDLDVDALYLAGLGRVADDAGRAYFTDAMEAGTLTREGVAQGIAGSAEYQARHASAATDAVSRIYDDALGRAADPEGLAFFADAYDSRGAAAVLLAVTASPEHAVREDARASGDYLFA